MVRDRMIVAVVALSGLLVACGGDGTSAPPKDVGSVTLSIHHVFDGQPLTLGSDVTAPDGKALQIQVLRYWLSNVQLHQADGSSHAVPASYYLVEQTAEKTRTSLTIANIPQGDYTGLTLAVGVDEGHNHSIDVFEGELSTAVDMDWGWNSGFIFFKIEGDFDDNGTLSPFKAHVGKDELYREVTLTFGAPMSVTEGQESSVDLIGDTRLIFQDWDVLENPSVVGGPTESPAGVVASNYAQWFSLQE